MKYKLTKNTKEVAGITLYQIQALKDFGDAKEGDLGGWIEKEANLSQENNCWVYGNAWVYGDAWNKTPLHIHGTKHCLTNSKYGHITIGCKTETIDWWLSEEAERFAKDNGYSYGDICEYKEYILLIKRVGF